MKPELYQEMAELQVGHWWFAARRQVIATVMQRLDIHPGAQILEIGCGTGGNLAMLSEFGQVQAMEYDDHARSIAAALSSVSISAGGLPEPVPFADGQFDLVCLLDVLEHIADEQAALARVKRLLKPGGRVLITVPAYAWLWSSHDTLHHHHRRYSAAMLRRLIAKTDLEIVQLGYFNTFLFPLIAGVRIVKKWVGIVDGASDASMPSPWVNALLKKIFSFESHLVRHRLFPFGTSVLTVLSAGPEHEEDILV